MMPMRRELYPPDWRDISRRIREGRAGSQCEWPGCTARHNALGYWDRDGIWYEEDGERFIPDEAIRARGPVRCILTVAHLDHDTTNNTDDNLRAWCQLHHLRYDANHHQANARRTRHSRRAIGPLPGFEEAP